MGITAEIITPRGTVLRAERLVQVVLRRREERFEAGSEVIVRSRHGRMLVRLPRHVMRLEGEDGVTRVEVGGGFAEVRDDVVSVLTADARVVSTGVGRSCAPVG